MVFIFSYLWMGACEFIFYFWGLDRGIVIFGIEGVCACERVCLFLSDWKLVFQFFWKSLWLSMWYIWLAATLKGSAYTFLSKVLSYKAFTRHVPVLLEFKDIYSFFFLAFWISPRSPFIPTFRLFQPDGPQISRFPWCRNQKVYF